MTDIIIPSCKAYHELRMLVNVIKSTDSDEFNYIPTGYNASASVNRNAGLIRADNDIVIMIDDDIGGFYDGWQKDLIAPLLEENSQIAITSARLITPEGVNSPMLGSKYAIGLDYEIAEPAVLSAAIAFNQKLLAGIYFDPLYEGSGYEDTDFCFQVKRAFPEKRFAIINKCRLIHYHEMKNQSPYASQNKALFLSKWGQAALDSIS